MAEARFDPDAFQSRLVTQWLGRRWIARGAVTSTNDVAWQALASGAPDGLVVVADQQTRGRGRNGRVWYTAPGKALALSLLLREGCERRPLGVVPLACGLALGRALEILGVETELKWPNDVLLGGRKLSGILCESRTAAGGPSVDRATGGPASATATAVVIGVGVNVAQRTDDFPPELLEADPDRGRVPATSLALVGHALGREEVAAEFLNAFEPVWNELGTRGADPVLEAWRCRAGTWGQRVRILGTTGPLDGIAQDLDPEGGLVLALDGGGRVTVRVGDLVSIGAGAAAKR